MEAERVSSSLNQLKRRKTKNSADEEKKTTNDDELPPVVINAKHNLQTECLQSSLESCSYWLTRIVFLRSLTFVYCKYLFLIFERVACLFIINDDHDHE